MRYWRSFAGALVFCFVLLCSPLVTEAQVIPVGVEPVIELEPSYPKPGQSFIARLHIYSDTARTVVWSVDGTAISGSGQKNEISLVAPGLGESMRISARAETAGLPITVSRTLTPAEVDIVVEGDTIAPYFYEGRRVPGPGTPATLITIPHIYASNGTRIDGSNLVYTWSINNTIAAEGVGLDRFTVPSQNLGEASVRLSIASQSGSLWYETVFSIPRTEPSVAFYPVSPLTGLSRNAVQDSYFEAETEATLRAEPYGIAEDVFMNAQYSWRVGGADVNNQSTDPQLITLRGEGGGATDVGFSIRNLSALSQYATGLFQMVFN